MKVIDCSFDNIPVTFDGVLLLGTFDGVHKGHISLVREALNHTDSVGALLFKNNPADIFEKDKEHYVLTPLEDKIRRFANDGVETLYVIDNDENFYKHTKEEFIDFLHRLGVRRLCVGEDYTFGYQRSGTASDLSKEFLTFIVPLLSIDGKKVATRQVFEFLKDGDIENANKFLGYQYEVKGKIGYGYGNGHKIGFPTANLEMSLPYLLPKAGVYLGLFYLRGVPHQAIINVGKNPTVGLLKHPVVESYIKDVDEDLYGEYVYIAFLRRIRDEKKFDSLEDLKKQLELDKKEFLK